MECHQLSNYTTSKCVDSTIYINFVIMLSIIGFFYSMLFNYFF